MQWKNPSDVIYDDNKRGRHMILDKNIISFSQSESVSRPLHPQSSRFTEMTEIYRRHIGGRKRRETQQKVNSSIIRNTPDSNTQRKTSDTTKKRDVASRSKDANVTIK